MFSPAYLRDIGPECFNYSIFDVGMGQGQKLTCGCRLHPSHTLPIRLTLGLGEDTGTCTYTLQPVVTGAKIITDMMLQFPNQLKIIFTIFKNLNYMYIVHNSHRKEVGNVSPTCVYYMGGGGGEPPGCTLNCQGIHNVALAKLHAHVHD